MSEPLDLHELADEVADSNFPNERRTERLRALILGLGADPARSLPRSFDSAGLEAAYRFFSNVHVTPDSILAPHVASTRARCSEHASFLIVHDSTKFTYRPDGRRRGLGRVRSSAKHGQQAFFAHFSLAIAADGTRRPLGVGGLKAWTREAEASGTEYLRWEEQIRHASDVLDGSSRAIHVMDREADDYQMFHALSRDGHRFVSRVMFDRRIYDSSSNHLRELVAQSPSTVAREVPLTKRRAKRDPAANKVHPPRESRTALLNVSATTVTLKRPSKPRKHGEKPPESLSLNVVRVWEPTPPDGAAPVEWLLYTTEPITTPEQQLAIVDHYRARWTIEEFNKAIKTGCEFESRQLQDYESLVNLLATFAPIAYQMLLVRSAARATPDADASSTLSSDHIDVLRARGRIKLPLKPTVRDVYLAIAALGGHLKRNGDPGWLTLSRGFEKLETLTEGWIAAKLQLRRDQ